MMSLAIILVFSIYIMWRSRFRVKPNRKINFDENKAVKLPDITLHKASESIRKIDEDSACEIYENSNTVATKLDIHESREIIVTNNEGNNSETRINAENMQEKNSLIPLNCSLKTTDDETLAEEQLAQRTTAKFSYSFTFSGETRIYPDIYKSDELPHANVETQKMNPSLLTCEDLIDSLKSLKTTSFDNSDTKSTDSLTNTIVPINGTTNITTSLTSQISNPSRFSSLKIIQSDTFASAAQRLAHTVASTMTENLLSASASSWASSKSNKPVNAWTYVRPDKMPLISIDGINIKDIVTENIMPTVEDKKQKSLPIFGAKDNALESHKVEVNDIPIVAQSLKEPAVTPPQDPPIMFKFTAQNKKITAESGAAIITSSSNISAIANTKSAGFTFNAPKPNGPASYRTKPTTASTSRYTQSSSRLEQNKSKPALSFATSVPTLSQNKSKPVFSRATSVSSLKENKSKQALSLATPVPSLGQNKSTAAFSFTTPTPSLGQNKSTSVFSFANPTSSLGQNKSMPGFSFGTPTPSLRQNKSTLVFSFANPISSLGQDKSTPGFSFGIPTSGLEQNKPISVFGSTVPASSTDSKLPDSVLVVTSKLEFGAPTPETVFDKEARGNTINPSPTIASSCNTQPMSNVTYKSAPTSSKETSLYCFSNQRKIVKGLRKYERYGLIKRS